MGYEVADFQKDVIEASRSTPILVDFWAPWCGPCRTLGPILEKLDNEAAGAWKLVKVNTDEHPEMSTQFGIKGIPAVKLFIDGHVADEFTGALPEIAVRQWLEKAMPSRAKDDLVHAEALLEVGNTEAAASVLEGVLADEPTNPHACALLATLVVFDDPARARTLAETAMTGAVEDVQRAGAVRMLAELLAIDPNALPNEAGRDAFQSGLAAVIARDFGTAVPHFIEVLKQNRYYFDDAARKAGVAVFTLLGEQHEVTRAHRRTFDMWLY